MRLIEHISSGEQQPLTKLEHAKVLEGISFCKKNSNFVKTGLLDYWLEVEEYANKGHRLKLKHKRLIEKTLRITKRKLNLLLPE